MTAELRILHPCPCKYLGYTYAGTKARFKKYWPPMELRISGGRGSQAHHDEFEKKSSGSCILFLSRTMKAEPSRQWTYLWWDRPQMKFGWLKVYFQVSVRTSTLGGRPLRIYKRSPHSLCCMPGSIESFCCFFFLLTPFFRAFFALFLLQNCAEISSAIVHMIPNMENPNSSPMEPPTAARSLGKSYRGRTLLVCTVSVSK